MSEINHLATAQAKNEYAMTNVGFLRAFLWQRSAMIHATLALAEEQRLANLIAYGARLDGQFNSANSRGEADITFVVDQDELTESLNRVDTVNVRIREVLDL